MITEPAAPAIPVDVPPVELCRALAHPSWTAEVWPSGQRAWLHLAGRSARIVAAGPGSTAADRSVRVDRAQALLDEAAAGGAFECVGEASFDIIVVGCGEVRIDPLDVVRLDGAPLAALPYAVRALALADALARLREARPSGSIPLVRSMRTPSLGAAKRSLAGGSDPVRVVLRDLRAPYGMPGAILRVPSATAGFFDDPWRDALDPAWAGA